MYGHSRRLACVFLPPTVFSSSQTLCVEPWSSNSITYSAEIDPEKDDNGQEINNKVVKKQKTKTWMITLSFATKNSRVWVIKKRADVSFCHKGDGRYGSVALGVSGTKWNVLCLHLCVCVCLCCAYHRVVAPEGKSPEKSLLHTKTVSLST